RLSAFLAGPARSSSHFIAEFVEGHVIATGDRGSTSANRAQFSGGRDFLRNAVREVGAQCLPHELRPGAVFVLPHPLQLFEHGGRQRDRQGGSGSGHGDKTKYDLIIPAWPHLSTCWRRPASGIRLHRGWWQIKRGVRRREKYLGQSSLQAAR